MISYEKGENIFYRVYHKSKKKFGLKRWRESTEKTVLLVTITALDIIEFAPRDIRNTFESIVGQKIGNLLEFISSRTCRGWRYHRSEEWAL